MTMALSNGSVSASTNSGSVYYANTMFGNLTLLQSTWHTSCLTEGWPARSLPCLSARLLLVCAGSLHQRILARSWLHACSLALLACSRACSLSGSALSHCRLLGTSQAALALARALTGYHALSAGGQSLSGRFALTASVFFNSSAVGNTHLILGTG